MVIRVNNLPFKMARKLAAKASLATRIDALSDADTVSTLGIDSRAYLEAQIKIEQERGVSQ